MDCGRYDATSNYEKEQEDLDVKRLAKIRLEEEEMMTLRPITSDKSSGKMVSEQDTSLPDGFLRKLAQQDEKKFKKVGILSPEEGAGMFADLGNNMFGNKEDRDLIESIQGKDNSNSDRGSSSSSKGKGSSMVDSFSREGDDDDLLESLKNQLGAKNLADLKNIPDITNPTGEGSSKVPTPTPTKKSTGAPAPVASIFDTREETRKVRQEDSQVTVPASVPVKAIITPVSTTTVPTAVTDFGGVGSAGAVGSGSGVGVVKSKNSGEGDIFETQKTLTPQYGPALTSVEAEKLQDSLDDMTDEEVAGVLSKLRAAVSDRIKEEVSDAMIASGISRKNATPNGQNSPNINGNSDENDSKRMPRAPSVNPEIRDKYEKELNAIEDELEKIYTDPLGTWQEMMANPERFLEENEIGSLTGSDE